MLQHVPCLLNWIHSVGERFVLKIHQNATIVLALLTFRSDGDRNVINVRAVGCVLMNFNTTRSVQFQLLLYAMHVCLSVADSEPNVKSYSLTH